MKSHLLVFAFALSTTLCCSAQDQTVKNLQTDAGRTIAKEEDTLQKAWRKGGQFSLNISQGSLNNWAAGGDEFSLSVNSILNAYAFYKKGHHSWDNTLDLNMGYIRTTSLGSRKNDDRIDLLSKYGHAITSHLSASALLNVRTQFLNGFTYSDTGKLFSSAFLSPAYLLLSAGVDYKPTQNLSIFVSPITSRTVIVRNDSLSDRGLYGVIPGHHSRAELGAFLSVNYLKDFNKVVGYKGRLDLFSNYKNNPEKIDVFMTNVLSVKLYKILSATWNVDLIYDDDIRIFGEDGKSPALQLKSLVGLGILVKF